jgi:hypothetical protein
MDNPLSMPVQGDAQVSERSRSYSDLKPTTFVKLAAAEVAARVAPAPGPLNSEVRWRLAKFWYGTEPAIHYELALHENTSQLEIGLHFESLADTNRAFYAAFDKCMLDIQRELGTSMWLEEWDRGWVRLYETHALWPLDTPRAHEIAARVLEVISILQPIYETICETPGHVPAVSTRSGRNSRY